MPAIARSLLVPFAGLACASGAARAAAAAPPAAADPSALARDFQVREREPARASGLPEVRQDLPADSGSASPVAIGGIKVEGAEGIPPAAFGPVEEQYVGRTLSVDELSRLANDIAAIARDYGYGLATASVPQQRMDNGILRVRLDQGRIDRVEVTGPAADKVRKLLAPLANGQPVRKEALERALLLAQDIPGVEIGQPKLERRGSESVLVVPTGRDPFKLRVDLDNWGTEEVGPLRARLSLDINGIFAGDDVLTVGGMSTPLQPGEFGLASISYLKAIGSGGTTFELVGYYAVSRPGAELKDFALESRSWEADARISQPLLRRRSASLWASAAFGVLRSADDAAAVRNREDHITAAELALNGSVRSGDLRVRGSLALRQGLNLLDATGSDDLLRSRLDADGTFSKLNGWIALDARLAPRLSLMLQAEGQIASGPLLSAEEMGLGGRHFLRAYDYREFFGDEGIAGSAELRWSPALTLGPIARTVFYLYVDAGSVGNYQGGFGSGSLASAGGGVRFGIGQKIDLGVEVGIPLVQGALPDKHYSPRVSVTVSSEID